MLLLQIALLLKTIRDVTLRRRLLMNILSNTVRNERIRDFYEV